MKSLKILFLCGFLALIMCKKDSPTEPTVNVPLPKMVYIPAGEFWMGNNFNEGDSNEIPVHTVYLDAYYIGKYEVTNEQYCQFLNEMGKHAEGDTTWLDMNTSVEFYPIELSGGIYKPKPGRAEHPVCWVTWYGARAYCTWLTNKTVYTYRLPTEAEWEKAARGTDQRRYPWGGHSANFLDDIDGSYANYYHSGDPYETGDEPKTTPVGYYDGSTHGSFVTHDNSSPYGAYDMAGNIDEWCYDWASLDYYQECYNQGIVTNPTGPLTDSHSRVLRGGSWLDNTYTVRSADRFAYRPNRTNSLTGFRCVREIK